MQWIPEEKGVIDKSAAKRIATLLEWQPKREWVGLTDEDTSAAWDAMKTYDDFDTYAKVIEAKLREKNT